MEQRETHRLLLVEDDIELASMVADYLGSQGFIVSVEHNGLAAAQRIVAEPYDVVVLDVGLPGMDGITICREVRSRFDGPILMLTARGNEIDEVVALEVGADDYMAKPVRPRALLARLRIHLRRTKVAHSPSAPKRLEVSSISIDSANRNVIIEGENVKLTTAEFDLLWLLAENAGNVVTREMMYQNLHGVQYDGLDRSIDLRVSRLRKKIGDDPNHPARIKSVRGVGYLLATDS